MKVINDNRTVSLNWKRLTTHVKSSHLAVTNCFVKTFISICDICLIAAANKCLLIIYLQDISLMGFFPYKAVRSLIILKF